MDPDDLLTDAQPAHDAALDRLAVEGDTAARLDELGTLARRVAAGRLLARGDVTGFRAALADSGEYRRRLLALPVASAGSPSRRFFAKGRYTGLVDALLGGRDDAARALAGLSPRQLLVGVEYEEDFLHAELVEHLTEDDPRRWTADRRARARAISARLAELEAEGPSPRTEVLEALAHVELAALRAGLARWLDARALARREHDRTLLRSPWATFVDDALFFEGMVVGRFAAALGAPPPDEDVGLPELVLRELPPWSWP